MVQQTSLVAVRRGQDAVSVRPKDEGAGAKGSKQQKEVPIQRQHAAITNPLTAFVKSVLQ